LKVLLTGCAGFIGMHVCERLLARGDDLIGVDNLNAYYDVALKQARLARMQAHPNFRFVKLDIADRRAIASLFEQTKPHSVINLAAQAGVRYSLQNPHSYVDSNLVGFVNLLEGCRNTGVAHFVYASSSSVYGGNIRVPFSEHDGADHPVSLYAATKKANELMAHSYSHLFALPTTGLRFFTVYGPWGRPDMALSIFASAILEDRPIDVFNHGRMERDFTYIDDIAEGVVRLLDRPPAANPDFDKQQPDPATSWAPYRICNIGNHRPVDLMTYIQILETALGKTARKNFLPLQRGDVPVTWADTQLFQTLTGCAPATPVTTGVERFVEWYREYFGGKN